jgi:hypothetical protein
MYEVRMRKARARQVLRPLWKWCRVANRHGLRLTRHDFTSFEGGLCVDGMPAAEWIMAVCGCGEDGGSIHRHAF